MADQPPTEPVPASDPAGTAGTMEPQAGGRPPWLFPAVLLGIGLLAVVLVAVLANSDDDDDEPGGRNPDLAAGTTTSTSLGSVSTAVIPTTVALPSTTVR